MSYENEHTGERIGWRPKVPASTVAGQVPPPTEAAKAGYEQEKAAASAKATRRVEPPESFTAL